MIPNRRNHITEKIDAPAFGGEFSVCVGFVDGHPCEVFVSQRAQPGTEMDQLLYDIGVTASKIMQGE